jgi:hypothetical protein
MNQHQARWARRKGSGEGPHKLKEYELERGGGWGYIKNIMNKEANLSKGGETNKFKKGKMNLKRGEGVKPN